MGKSKEEAYERFEKFIDDMSDAEFEYWYDEEATDAQQEFADKIRESVSPEESEKWLSVPWHYSKINPIFVLNAIIWLEIIGVVATIEIENQVLSIIENAWQKLYIKRRVLVDTGVDTVTKLYLLEYECRRCKRIFLSYFEPIDDIDKQILAQYYANGTQKITIFIKNSCMYG